MFIMQFTTKNYSLDYCKEDEVEDMKKILNNGTVTDTNCASNRSTAENDYVSMLERFINICYPDSNYGFFGLDASRAEAHVDKEMSYFGYNTEMVNKALLKTINDFKTNHKSVRFRLQSFVKDMLSKPHKDYANYCSTNFRFVLTLILGYLSKLDSVDIINCPDPKSYFEDKVSKVFVPDLTNAVNKTRAYVKKSNDSNLSEGMRMFEQWIEELAKEKLPPKEVTIADIEKQLGYKIKIVGDN